MNKKQEISSLIIESHNILKMENNYSPKNEVINNVLGNLVTKMIANGKSSKGLYKDISSDKKVSCHFCSLRYLCQKAECEMEEFWAKYFIQKEHLFYDDLKEFLYFNQYDKISSNEDKIIKKYANNVKKIAFVGSGPLPMTAIMLNKRNGYQLDLIDKSSRAIELSKSLCKNISNNLNFMCVDALEVDYSKYDLVFIASMVTDKMKLIDKIHSENVSHVVVRDADNFAQLFYEKLEKKIFSKYKPKAYIPANSDTINSSYLLERVD